MYAGHFAAALAIRAAEPRAPMWGLALGVGVLDIAFGGFVAVGIEQALPGGGLFIPWSHSLVTAPLFALGYAALFRKWGMRVALLMALAVWSHWLLDLASHHADIPLWPGSAVQLGFVNVFGGNAGWFETLITVSGGGWFLFHARRDSTFARAPIASVLVLGVCLALEWTQR